MQDIAGLCRNEMTEMHHTVHTCHRCHRPQCITILFTILNCGYLNQIIFLSDLADFGLQSALAILISIIFQSFVRASFAFEGDEHSFAGHGQFLDLTAFPKVVADLFLRGIPGNSWGLKKVENREENQDISSS